SLRSRDVDYALGLLIMVGMLVTLARKVWNPIGQLFFACYVAAALAYLAYGVRTTFGPGSSYAARAASLLLLILEFGALAIGTSFTFESCDTVCRTRPSRQLPKPDPNYVPLVSVQIAAYNEHSDMLIDTLESLAQLDYP